ncbi:MAG: iron-containing alcohol dehydrogenase family protein [Clostridiales bacterium]|nr:iron-containing alcohol dehydrogenase family protein [Clostridiales bacterium]
MKRITNTTVSIPSILKIESGALCTIGRILKESGLTEVVILFGNGLVKLFGDAVFNSLAENGIEVLTFTELDTVELEDITRLAFSMPNTMQAVIGIGGGKVIDAAKYCGFLRNTAFISVPTSPSSDGFASAGASLIIDGRRHSLPARMAYGIIIDTDVIKSAPRKFLYSGIGDMVSKITALYDWIFEEKKGYGRVNDCAVMVAKKAVNSFVRAPYETIEDDNFIKELLNSLALSGIANEIAGSSLPTSGSEHLISHALDKYSANPQLHGIQVGIATYLMSIVQEHRFNRVRTILADTGFFDYAQTLGLDINDYLSAIDYAPTIKPYRHTYLHDEKYRQIAKNVLKNDDILKKIFHVTSDMKE